MDQQRRFNPGDFVVCIKPTTVEEMQSYKDEVSWEDLMECFHIKQKLEEKIMKIYSFGNFKDGRVSLRFLCGPRTYVSYDEDRFAPYMP